MGRQLSACPYGRRGRTLAAYELGGRVLAALGTSPTEIRVESAFLKACREASFSEGDLYEGIEMRDIFGRGFFPLVNRMIFNHHVHLSRAVATRRVVIPPVPAFCLSMVGAEGVCSDVACRVAINGGVPRLKNRAAVRRIAAKVCNGILWNNDAAHHVVTAFGECEHTI